MLIPVINGKLQHEVPQSQEEQSILLTIKSDLWKKICTQIMGASSKTTKIKLQHRRGHRSRRVDHPIHTWLTTVQWSSPVAEPWINDWWVGFSWSYHVDFCYSTISCVYIDNLHIFSKIKDTLKDVNQIFIYIYIYYMCMYVLLMLRADVMRGLLWLQSKPFHNVWGILVQNAWDSASRMELFPTVLNFGESSDYENRHLPVCLWFWNHRPCVCWKKRDQLIMVKNSVATIPVRHTLESDLLGSAKTACNPYNLWHK